MPADPLPPLPGVAKTNIDAIVNLEREMLQQRSTADRIGNRITRFAGSVPFLAANVVWFSIWVALNTGLIPGVRPFDPYPFNFLCLLVAWEAIFLTTFVLMTQARQDRHADQWAHLDLQLSLLAEQESTKMLGMLQMICGRMGLEQVAGDEELKEMISKTQVEGLAEE